MAYGCASIEARNPGSTTAGRAFMACVRLAKEAQFPVPFVRCEHITLDHRKTRRAVRDVRCINSIDHPGCWRTAVSDLPAACHLWVVAAVQLQSACTRRRPHGATRQCCVKKLSFGNSSRSIRHGVHHAPVTRYQETFGDLATSPTWLVVGATVQYTILCSAAIRS